VWVDGDAAPVGFHVRARTADRAELGKPFDGARGPDSLEEERNASDPHSAREWTADARARWRQLSPEELLVGEGLLFRILVFRSIRPHAGRRRR
jgi:hypothetical protein